MKLGLLHVFECPKLPGGNGCASAGGTSHSTAALWLWWFMLGSEPGTNSLKSRFGRNMDMLGILQVLTHMIDASEGSNMKETTTPQKTNMKMEK